MLAALLCYALLGSRELGIIMNYHGHGRIMMIVSESGREVCDTLGRDEKL